MGFLMYKVDGEFGPSFQKILISAGKQNNRASNILSYLEELGLKKKRLNPVFLAVCGSGSLVRKLLALLLLTFLYKELEISVYKYKNIFCVGGRWGKDEGEVLIRR